MANAEHSAAPLMGPTRRLLAACARSQMHEGQRLAIERALGEVERWDDFLALAEAEGMAPLAQRHLATFRERLPAEIARLLSAMTLQRRRAQALRGQALCDMARALAAAGIDPLWLKGSALAYQVYDEPGLRPMRDIDLLVAERDAQRAQAALIAGGLCVDLEGQQATPDSHHHLPALIGHVAGMPISVEVHRAVRVRHERLLLRYEDFAPHAQTFEVQGQTLRSPSREDTLWLVYRHAFCGPLRWERYRLIWVADLESLVERWQDDMDWERVRARYGEALRILPVLHHLTPLHPDLVQKLGLDVDRAPRDVGESFRGAPLVPWAELQAQRGLLHALSDTFSPPDWWMRMHYGTGNSRLRRLASYARHAYDVLSTLG